MNILVIDDNVVETELMKNILSERQDFQVEVFNHSTAALAYIQCAEDHIIDLVLCDYHMPDVSGLKVLKAFRKRYAFTPFVFVSANTNKSLVMECKRHGANGYIAKPYRAETLLQKIEQKCLMEIQLAV